MSRVPAVVPAFLLGMTIALASPGCGSGPGPGTGPALPAGDFAAFTSDVQPLLAEECGNPSCHGSEARPLALFSLHQHRRDPADVFRDLPLTEEELWLNYVGVLAFLDQIDDASRSLLLTKPLSPSSGGGDHVGGVQFEDRRSYGYRLLLGWAEAALAGVEEENP